MDMLSAKYLVNMMETKKYQQATINAEMQQKLFV